MGILGVFFAQFSLLGSLSELFALAFCVLANGNLPGDPAERLVEGAATIWERPAPAMMTVYVTGALTILGSTLLAARQPGLPGPPPGPIPRT